MPAETLPPVDQVLGKARMTYEQAETALRAAGYGDLEARHIASVATGRTDGDVKRRGRP